MVIKVNGEPIDYTLEKESSLQEVVKGVRAWAGGSGFVVTSIILGGKDILSAPEGSWASTPISTVSELDFRVLTPADVRLEHWAAVRVWMAALERELKFPGASLNDLALNISTTLLGIKKNPFLPPGSPDMERLSAILDGQDAASISGWPQEKREEAAAVLSRVGVVLDSRIKEAADPREAIGTQLPRLRELATAVIDVPLLLQTGRDRQAMEMVSAFTELFQKLLDIVPFLPKDGERDRVFEELNPILHQILSAFDARDFVLIGDLFEYEVAPRLGRLTPLLEKCL